MPFHNIELEENVYAAVNLKRENSVFIYGIFHNKCPFITLNLKKVSRYAAVNLK